MTPSLVVGPLQAYRYWHVKWDSGQPVLQSLYHPTIWPADGPLRATCERRPGSLVSWVRSLLSRDAETHPSPAWGCECGVYALRHFEADEDRELSPQIYQRGLFDRAIHVAGVVLLWGRVVQHEHGFRAEYGRPVKLLTVPPLVAVREVKYLLEAVAHRYGIELVTRVDKLNCPA